LIICPINVILCVSSTILINIKLSQLLIFIGNLPSNNPSPNQSQSLSTPVNTSALAVLSGLSADRLGIETQNRRSRK